MFCPETRLRTAELHDSPPSLMFNVVNLILFILQWDRGDRWDSRLNIIFPLSHLASNLLGQMGRFRTRTFILVHMRGI